MLCVHIFPNNTRNDVNASAKIVLGDIVKTIDPDFFEPHDNGIGTGIIKWTDLVDPTKGQNDTNDLNFNG